MAKGDKFYFENYRASTALAKQAAEYLLTCMENYKSENLQNMIAEMHEIEHNADVKKHEMSAALAKAFVTPVDREDLDLLSHRIDDVADDFEEVLQRFYVHDIKEVQPHAIDFAKHLVKAAGLLCELLDEFENFKKSKRIKELIIELNDVEEVCDKLYLRSMRGLVADGYDVLRIIAWRDIYEHMESCMDACEHVGDCIASVIMKNT